MSIQLLKTKIQENKSYVPNQILDTLTYICEGIGFNEVSHLDIMAYKQGSTITFWNENDECVQFENNISEPSIYMDCEISTMNFIKDKLKNTMSKYNGTAFGCDIVFKLDERVI